MQLFLKNKYKKVTGLLEYNIETRNEHLKRNLGKYSQYGADLAPAIGEPYTIDYNRLLVDITGGKGLLDYSDGTRNDHLKRNLEKYTKYDGNSKSIIAQPYTVDVDRRLEDITNGKDLLEYTQEKGTTYGDYINERYFANTPEEEKEVVGFDDHIYREELMKWRGKYPNYITYLDQVLGEDIYSRHVRYVNDFLSGQYIENALRQTEVGVVRDINVAVAKQGIITTNLNNMSGKDTPLGTITNYMYANSLYNGAIFNSDRHSENKYLTPTLINQYGNNLANVMELGDMLRVGVNDYELKEDLSADAYIIHDFNETLKGSLNLKYIVDQTDRATKYVNENLKGYKGYYPIGKDGYVKIEHDGYHNPYVDTKDFEVDSTEFTSADHFTDDNTKAISGIGGKTYGTYMDGKSRPTMQPNIESDAQWEKYEGIGTGLSGKTLLAKTARMFNENKIDTLIGRFHTEFDNGLNNKKEFIDTAKSKFGNSHGRNLITREAQESGIGNNKPGIGNGYENPYCRTWTYHHQYNQVKKLIRPFMDGDKPMSIADVQNRLGRYRSRYKLADRTEEYGGYYLGENTVLNNNGFVNICPSNQTDNTVKIKNCMFSLENLAWKDVPKDEKFNYISREQTGPNGGRIMWFPPYDLSFQENVNVDWEQNTFIGRGEKVYTYKNTDRTGTLSFTMLIDHPSIVNSFAKLEDSNGGNGYAVSDDIDADILRFFAGCDMPDIKAVERSEEPGAETAPKQEPIVETKSGTISFNVYFPNNYSGTMTKNREAKYFQNDSVNNDGNKYDANWWKYLLFGNNSGVYDDPEKWIGYEISDGSGISSGEATAEIKDDWQCVCNTWAEKPNRDDVIGQACTECWSESSKDTGTNVYKYKVDPDLQQKLNSEDSYSDNESFQLNSKLEGNENSTATHSFAEIVGALLNSGKLSWNGSTDVNDAINFLVANGGAKKDEIDWLTELFINNKVTYESVYFNGSATEKDLKNSQMLARRRAISVRKLLEETLFNNAENEIKKNYNGQPAPSKAGQEVQSISSKDDKLQRSTTVIIEFKYPDTVTKLEDNSAAATTPKKNATTGATTGYSEDTFDEWYEELMQNSSIMQEYQAMFEMEDYQEEYETFKRDIKQICKEKNISTNVEDYHHDDSKWNSAVNILLETYGNKPSVPSTLYLQYICPLLSLMDDDLTKKPKTEIYYNKIWENNTFGDSIYSYYSKKLSDNVYIDIDEGALEDCEIKNLNVYKTTELIFEEGFNEPVIYVSRVELDKLIFDYLLKDVEEGFIFACDMVTNKEKYGYYQTLVACQEYLSDEENQDRWEIPYAVYQENKNNKYLQGSKIADIFEERDVVIYLFESTIALLNPPIDENELQYKVNDINILIDKYICHGEGNCQFIVLANYNLETEEDRATLANDLQTAETNIFNGMADVVTAFTTDEIEKVNTNLISYGKNSANAEKDTLTEEAKQIMQQKYEAAQKQAAEAAKERNKRHTIYQAFNGTLVTRYETEADYFNKLEMDSPLIFRSLKQKFKYFNPAFHSMSPEGFNARLNFLQQCTRQGHTVEIGTSLGSGAANNLAFGRMPVCVLRIGDFINTRIIIQNMTIQYDNSGGMQWDLNPEGIGVQPMYAKVNLGIVLLGGQSLEGPISRLQNAITFDYYANTGVYDDRADRAIYVGDNGEQKYKHVFVAKDTDAEKETATDSNAEANGEIQEKTEPITKAQEQVDAMAQGPITDGNYVMQNSANSSAASENGSWNNSWNVKEEVPYWQQTMEKIKQ